MKKYIRWLDKWGEEAFVSAMLTFLIGILAIGVFSRFLMNKSFPWVEEVCSYLFIWSSYIGIAIAVKHKEQLRVLILMDLIAKKYPAVVRACYIVSEIIFSVFCVIVFYYSLRMLENMTTFPQVSAALEIDVFYPYLIIPVSMALTAFRTLQTVYRDIKAGTLQYVSKEE